MRGSSKSTPEVSGEPISKISGSSIESARLPVKVLGSSMACSGTNSFGISTMKNLAQRGLIGGDIVRGCYFRRGHNDEIRKRRIAGPQPARGHAADDAAIRERIDDLARQAWAS